MKVTKIAFQVLPVISIARARDFYEDVLELRASRIFEKDGSGEIDYDIAGARLSIVCGSQSYGEVKPGGMVALEVDSFNEVLMRIRAKQFKIISGPSETAEAHLAIVSDPDGNQIIIHKTKAAGKKEFVVI